MKYLALLFPLLMAATCGDDYAPTTRIDIHATQAIADWKAQGLSWHQRCSPYLVYLHPVDGDDLPGICGVDAQLYACLDGFDIYIDEAIMNTVRSDYVVEHELRHWLGGCEYGTVDGAHTIAAFWYPYRGTDIRQ